MSQRFAVVTVNNASDLAAAGANVRIEIGLGTAPTSFALLHILTSADLAAGRTSFRIPRADAGSSHSVRMRTEKPGMRPSAYTAAVAVTLDPIAPPTSLTVTARAGDCSLADLSWTNGETIYPVEVRYKATGATAWRSVMLPAGSTSATIGTLLASTAYSFDVRYHEKAPASGVSTSATGSLTTGSTARTLTAPENPSAFAGSIDYTGAFINDGTFGLEVTGTDFPGSIAFEVALETAPGAGTFGSFVEPPRGTVSAAQRPARTRFVGLASNDGLKRRLRAKTVRVGATDSSYTPVVDVLPYAPQRPIEYKVDVPALTLSYDSTTQGNTARGEIVISFTAPTSPQHGHLEYSVRQRVPAGTWGAPSIVIGTKLGPDTITAQAGQQYGITPITVTLNDETRNVGATEYTLTVPAFSLSGPAGGDLTGTYPNPSLVALGSAIGPLGSATRVPVVTRDTKGRVTALTDIAIAFPSPSASAFVTLTDGATVTWATGGDPTPNAVVTIAGNRTLAITGAVSGQCGTLEVIQGSGGSHTLTLPAGSLVRDSGAGAITLSTTAGDVDVLSYIYDGSSFLWTYGKKFT